MGINISMEEIAKSLECCSDMKFKGCKSCPVDKAGIIGCFVTKKAAAKLLIEQQKRIEELEERVAIMSEPHVWISCAEEKPRMTGYYLTVSEKDNQNVMWFNWEKDVFYMFDWSEKVAAKQPKYWMNLPEAPKEDEKDD